VVNSVSTNLSYVVTVFDPEVPGVDYQPLAISGSGQPQVGLSNLYVFPAVSNATSYQWRYTRRVPFSLRDGAEGGLSNFIAHVSSGYSVVTTSPVASGTHSFQLAHVEPTPQWLMLNYTLNPLTNGVLQFKSRLGTATTNQVARVQVSTNEGRSWFDVFTQPGAGSSGEISFSTKKIALTGFAGESLQVRFNYDLGFGNYYPQAGASVGWHFDDISITNTEQMLTVATNSVPTNRFAFIPPQPGNYNLQGRAVIFTDFPLDWGPVKPVEAIVGPPVIVLRPVTLTNGQVRIDFTLQAGAASAFKLLETSQLDGGWRVDTRATLRTNIPGVSYVFTTTPGGATHYYRVQTP
jgi:hypothetical protein